MPAARPSSLWERIKTLRTQFGAILGPFEAWLLMRGLRTLDARVRARLGYGLEAFAVGENLLDRRYQEVLGYPALGRVVRAGLRFQSGPSRP